MIIVAFFFLTGFVSQAYHWKLDSLGKQWLESGQRELQSGNAAQALVDFRTALVYEPDVPQIQLPLAEALAASGRDAEARAYLLGLLAHSPSDAPVNLALARIAVRSGSEVDALRYYHAAIFGIWPQDPVAKRLETRFELCQYLLTRNDTSSAEAELIAFSSEIPPADVQSHVQAGGMFVRAGDLTRALEEFRRAVAAGPSFLVALRGAGLTAFQLGDYRQADTYLGRALRLEKSDSEAAEALKTTRLVLSADPNEPGLTLDKRRSRVRTDFQQAFSRLQSCMKTLGATGSSASTKQSDLATLFTKARAMRLRLPDRLLRRTEDLNAALDFAFEIENLCAQKCGSPHGADEALLLLQKSLQGKPR